MKKILMLGASPVQIPSIRYALSRGYSVITADNRPENPGHRLAHRNYFISTLEKESLLAAAEKEKVDGVLTYGSDVSAPAAAFIAEKMGLAGTSYETALNLTEKSRFRALLAKEGLQKDFSFSSFSLSEKEEAIDSLLSRPFPFVVKPVDSSGSKGVSILHSRDDVRVKVDFAFRESVSGRIIAEKFVERRGRQICGDGFMKNGRLEFIEFGDGYFYDTPELLAPYGESFPSTHDAGTLDVMRLRMERVLVAAGYLRGPFNFDVWVTDQGEPFINEIGPRSGGNFIPTALSLKTGIDWTGAAVEFCLGDDVFPPFAGADPDRFYACYMLHSLREGIYGGIELDGEIQKSVVRHHPYSLPESRIYPFTQGNRAVGNLILSFGSFGEMLERMRRIRSVCRVVLR